jgi:hypothetical protein
MQSSELKRPASKLPMQFYSDAFSPTGTFIFPIQVRLLESWTEHTWTPFIAISSNMTNDTEPEVNMGPANPTARPTVLVKEYFR